MQPIQVTLSFANAAEMVAYFQGSPLPVVQEPEVKKPASAASGQRTAKATAAPVSTATEPTPSAASVATPAPASTAATAPQEIADPKPEPTTSSVKPSESVEYPVLQKAVFTLAGKSREAAAAVAASMGVKTFKELDATRWAEALAAVNAKIAELG